MVFSVVALFFLVAASGLPWVRRPELWLAVLVVVFPFSLWIGRLMLGRPFLLSMAVVVTLLFLWTRQPAPARWVRVTLGVAGFALAAWMHGGWYLWLLLVLAFFLCREWRTGWEVAGCWVGGVLIAGILAGDLFAFLGDQVRHLQLALAGGLPGNLMVSEFQPGHGYPVSIGTVVAVIFIRHLAGGGIPPLLQMPTFVMMLLGWAGSFQNMRFWVDWGVAAMMVWMVQMLEPAWERWVVRPPLQRLMVGGFLAGVLFLQVTVDADARWTTQTGKTTLVRHWFEGAEAWLPGEGGVVYNPQMATFYELMHAYPRNEWRFVLGFEPGLMRPDDLAIYRRILESDDMRTMMDWVNRMGPNDRLVMELTRKETPPLPQLEWRQFGGRWWVGRVPTGE